MLLRRKAVKISRVAAVLQQSEKRLRLRVATSAKERLSSLEPGPTDELNVDVTSRIERRHLGFIDQQ